MEIVKQLQIKSRLWHHNKTTTLLRVELGLELQMEESVMIQLKVPEGLWGYVTH